MHARSDNHQVQQALNAYGEAHVTMMKKRVRLKDDLVNGEHPCGQTDDADLDDAECCRERHLANVKPKRRRHVEIRIDVMDVMKSPEKRDAVIRHVPPVERQIHQEKCEHELNGH